MDIPLPIIHMSSRPSNYYNPNAQPNSSMSGPHSQGSKGSYPPPGYLPSPGHSFQPHPAHALQPSSARSLQPPPAHSLQPPPAHVLHPPPAYDLQSGPLLPDPPYSPHNPGPSRSGPSHPDDGTGRYYPRPRYPGSQSGPPPPGDDTGRYYSPRYSPQNSPQNTHSLQAVIPRRQDLSPSTSYNPYTPNVPSLLAHGTSQSSPLPPPLHPPPNPGVLEQSGPPLADPPPPGGTRRHSDLLSMMRYVNEFFL
jgi:hypothetical protein